VVPILIDQVSKAISLCRRASLSNGQGKSMPVVPMFWSESGIGKTTLCRDYRDRWEAALKAKADASGLDTHEVDVGLDVHNMAMEDALELGGLPMPDRKSRRTVYYPQKRMPLIEDGDGHNVTPAVGVMLFDDMDKSSRSVQPALYTIFADHEIGGVPLKPLWCKVGTGNGKAVDPLAEDLSAPLKRRLVHYYVTTSSSAVERYASSHKWNATVQACIAAHKDSIMPSLPVFEDMAVPLKDDGTASNPCPRQLEYYSRCMDVIEGDMGEYGGIMFQTIQGCVGLSLAAKEAHRIATKGQVPTVSQLCQGWTQVPDKAYRHWLPLTFALLGIPGREVTDNGDKCAAYLKLCLDAGVNREIIRLGVVCLSLTWPRVWGCGWTIEFA